MRDRALKQLMPISDYARAQRRSLRSDDAAKPCFGRQPAKRRARLALIVLPAPGFDLGPSVGQQQEPLRFQAFVAQATTERFNKGIVGWLARPR